MKLPNEDKLEQQEVKDRLKKLFERFEGNRGLHAKVRWRMQHFYLDPAVDPLMPGSTRTADGKMKPGRWQSAATQTTWVQDTFFKWKSRMMENPFRIEGRAMVDTIPNKAKANNAEALLVQGFEFIRERTGIDIQANLVDAKGYKAAGVLHWRIDESAYKANMPDYEETDDTETDAERYTEDEYAEETGRKKAKKYRETEDSLKDRISRYKAECGFPVFLETVTVEQCAWTRDKSTHSEFRDFAVKRVIPNLGDWKKIKHEDYKLRERESPSQDVMNALERWTPSSQDFEKHEVTIYEYWTRRYWYEWAEVDGESYFDCGEHYYGMPPFALDYGRYTDSADPMWAYAPVFHSMLEEKPNYDRLNSLTNAAAEEAAILTYVLQPTANGVPQFQSTDGDDPLDMSLDSGDAARVPSGYKLEAVGGQGVNNQLFKLLELSQQRMEAAQPSTGFATFGATTQPTSAWQEQAQENMEPKMHIRGTARCIQVAANNLVRCFADKENGPGEIFGYARADDGTLDRTKVLSVDPDGWDGVIIDVKIAEVGNVERGALEELGMTKLKAGLITEIEYIGDYEGKVNPEQTYVQRKAFLGYEKEVMPMQIRQSMAKAFGVEIALAPGAVPMVNGQQVSDEQAIQSVGGTPMNQVPGSQMMVNAAPSTQMQNQMPQAQPAQASPQPAGVF